MRDALTRVRSGEIASIAPFGRRCGLVALAAEVRVLELGRAKKARLARNQHVAERDVGANAAACAGRDEQLRRNRLCDFRHELSHWRRRAVIVEVQARLEEQHARVADRAGKVKAEAMVVARHVRRAVIERGPLASHHRDVAVGTVPVFIPPRWQIVRGEQRAQGRGFRRGPRDDHDVVAVEPAQVVALRRLRIERRRFRSQPLRPRHDAGGAVPSSSGTPLRRQPPESAVAEIPGRN